MKIMQHHRKGEKPLLTKRTFTRTDYISIYNIPYILNKLFDYFSAFFRCREKVND